jgi:DNA-binding transcriptional ArsR family regulator
LWALDELKRREPMPSVLYTGVAETYAGDPVEWQMGHHSAALLEEDWAARAAVLAALGHPSRLRILQLVARGEALTAPDLAHTDGLGSTGQIYHHLRLLVSAGWLRSTTKGQHEVPAERLVPLLVVLAASR